jgi:threonine dehydratase
MTVPVDQPGRDRLEVTPEIVAEAAARLSPHVHRTPVLRCRTLDARCGCQVFFKCENFQRVGAFKFRGAMNAVLQLTDHEKSRGVITHSSGNHAQALALAGNLLGVPVCVVMPANAPQIKRAATSGYGARIVSCEPTLAAREATVATEIARHGYLLVHPFDDWRVIAGQGTAAWELLDDAAPLDLIVAPCGGGGLLAGTALAVQAKSPRTRLIGVEPERADDARRSLEAGRILPSGDPFTIADGLRTSLGSRSFAVIGRHVERIVTATEAEIVDALRFILERMKIVIEPSSAVPVAPILTGSLDVKGARVGVILSGGNLDLEPLFQTLAARWLRG